MRRSERRSRFLNWLLTVLLIASLGVTSYRWEKADKRAQDAEEALSGSPAAMCGAKSPPVFVSGLGEL